MGLFVYLLPLLIVWVELRGSANRWGEKRGDFGFVIQVLSPAFATRLLTWPVLVAAVYVSAKFLGIASQSFRGAHDLLPVSHCDGLR